MALTGRKIKTSIYIPEDLHWTFKEAAVKRRLSDTAAMVEALARWTEEVFASQAGNVQVPDAAAQPTEAHRLTAEESRILAAMRGGSLETRKRILAAAAKLDEPRDLSMELYPVPPQARAEKAAQPARRPQKKAQRGS